MVTETVQSEHEILSKLADNLARQGYEVVREPRPRDLPKFLREYQPDLIAHRGDEHLVIEIKSGRRATKPSYWRALAEEVARHPGWQFQLILGEAPKGPQITMPPPPSLVEIRNQLSSTRRLYDRGEHAAALLLLWSLLEAASQQHLGALDARSNRPKTPIALLKDLVSFGLLDQKEYDKLARVIELRNAAAHGRSNVQIDRPTFARLFKLVDNLAKIPLEPINIG